MFSDRFLDNDNSIMFINTAISVHVFYSFEIEGNNLTHPFACLSANHNFSLYPNRFALSWTHVE